VSTSSAWSWDPALGLQCLVRGGDAIQVQPGLFRTVSSAASVPYANGDGRPLGFANDGTAVLRLAMNDGSRAMVSVHVGSLAGLPRAISAATGGTHTLYLNAGPAHAGQVFIVAGSVSGTFPGTQIGIFNVPLNADAYTQLMLQSANMAPFVNTVGTLDAEGRAIAQLVIPPIPGLVGIVADHAFALIDLGFIAFASQAARLQVVP
jgi:hypothetical protein